jgi:hypothetical protein
MSNESELACCDCENLLERRFLSGLFWGRFFDGYIGILSPFLFGVSWRRELFFLMSYGREDICLTKNPSTTCFGNQLFCLLSMFPHLFCTESRIIKEY